MSSSEFAHGPYIIKTFQRDGECRARAFHNGVWLRDVSDWTAGTVAETVRRMRASLDALEEQEEEADEAAHAPPPAAPFLSRAAR
jgi:hypothetical protein